MAETPQNDNEPDLDTMMRDAATLDQAVARAQEFAVNDNAARRTAIAAQAYEDALVYNEPGVGRYVIPAQPGWPFLVKLVDDPSVDINFSVTNYPTFDTILSGRAASDHLDNPEDDLYATATWKHVRENIAAVRNFLMETYYTNRPPGMSDAQVRTALEQIAAFVGDGLHNNYRFAGIIDHHHRNEPFIDLDHAAQGGGAGAQYIYSQILKMQRQSNWNVIDWLTGKHKYDWKLPSAVNTALLGTAAAFGGDKTNAPVDAEAEAELQNLRAEKQSLLNVFQMRAAEVIEDLESIGERLLHTAEESLDAISSMKPERLDEAVRLAKDILDKLKNLKITGKDGHAIGVLGDRDALSGLGLRPEDDASAFGDLTSVGDMYGRLLAWARGIDPSIAQNPSIAAATLAVGQLGYMAKAEALRLAQAVGNSTLANRIAARMGAIAAYRPPVGKTMGELLDQVRGGIDTVMQMKTITGPGAAVGHSASNELGNYMNAAPTAGLAMQTTGDGSNRNAAGKINEEMLRTQEAAAQAQASRVNSQIATRNVQQQSQGQPAQAQPPARTARGSQALIQARRQRLNTSVSPNALAQANLTAAQRSALMQRSAAIRAAHAHDDHHDDHHAPPVQMQRMQSLVNADMLKAMKAATNTQGLAGAPVVAGKANFQAMAASGKVTTNMYGKATSTPKPLAANDDEKRRKQQETLVQPPPPPNKGHGMGR